MTQPKDPAELLSAMFTAPQQLFSQFMPAGGELPSGDLAQWTDVSQRLHKLWFDFQQGQAEGAMAKLPAMLADPGSFAGIMQGWFKALPLANPETQKRMWEDSLALWEGVLGQYGIGPKADAAKDGGPDLPRKDRRFADPKWREQPFYALVHQTYLMLAEQVMAMASAVETGDPAKTEQLKFAARTLVEALSPANFPLLNPLVMEKAMTTRGESLVKGFEHLLGDLQRGQLTHVDPQAFKLGENIAATPGGVVFRNKMFELIQYTPTTEKAHKIPLLIFPPWINKFYILDLQPKSSLVKWLTEQGIAVYIVSWKNPREELRSYGMESYVTEGIVPAMQKVNALHGNDGINAADPFAAARIIQTQVPDVITLDVEMPRMDGIDFLGKLMRLRPMRASRIRTFALPRSCCATVQPHRSVAGRCAIKPRSAGYVKR